MRRQTFGNVRIESGWFVRRRDVKDFFKTAGSLSEEFGFGIWIVLFAQEIFV
jgi:hypothetical protein